MREDCSTRKKDRGKEDVLLCEACLLEWGDYEITAPAIVDEGLLRFDACLKCYCKILEEVINEIMKDIHTQRAKSKWELIISKFEDNCILADETAKYVDECSQRGWEEWEPDEPETECYEEWEDNSDYYVTERDVQRWELEQEGIDIDNVEDDNELDIYKND